MHACRVRHEAGEALGAIGGAHCLELLRAHQADPCLEVAQTCQLALQRIQHYDGASSSEAPLQPPASCSAPAAACAVRQGDSSGGSLAACQPAGVSARMRASPAPGGAHAAAAAVPQVSNRQAATLGTCPGAAPLHRCHQPAAAPAPEPEEASPYLSVDPAPAAPPGTPTPALRALLLDEAAPIFERYRCAHKTACLVPYCVLAIMRKQSSCGRCRHV